MIRSRQPEAHECGRLQMSALWSRFISSLVLCHLFVAAESQSVRRQAVYAELLGNGGGIVSLNYERMLSRTLNKPLQLSARCGFSMSFDQYDHAPIIHLPFELSAYYGQTKWRPDVGFGYTAFIGTSNLNDPRIPEEYKSNYANWYVVRIGVRRIGGSGGLLRLAPMYIWESHSNGRRSDFWGFGISFGFFL